MLFGEVVQTDGVESGFGDAFGAVEQGGDGGLADEAGEAADAAGGALSMALTSSRKGSLSPRRAGKAAQSMRGRRVRRAARRVLR